MQINAWNLIEAMQIKIAPEFCVRYNLLNIVFCGSAFSMGVDFVLKGRVDVYIESLREVPEKPNGRNRTGNVNKHLCGMQRNKSEVIGHKRKF